MGQAMVKYQHGAYKGVVEVQCDDNDDNDVIYARAKREIFRNIPGLSTCYESFKINSREYDE